MLEGDRGTYYPPCFSMFGEHIRTSIDGIEISGKHIKHLTNNKNGMTTDVQIVGSTLNEVQSFK